MTRLRPWTRIATTNNDGASDTPPRMARKHLDAVRRGPGRIKAEQNHFADAILDAHESGETIQDICEAAGMGRTKVYELIRLAKERRREE